MRNIKNLNQREFFDPWSNLGDKVYNRLHSSWAHLFRNHVLPQLPVSEFAKHFNATTGRPSKELHIGLGTILLQQLHDLSDEEVVDALAFNMQWHYALKISDNSDTNTYIAPKTLYNIRKAVMDSRLDYILFDNIRDEFLQLFNVDTDKQRMDSKHIRSNMGKLGRVSIFSKSINKFLTNLKKSKTDLFKLVDQDIIDRYLSQKSMQCFSMVKPSKASKTLAQVSQDLFTLTQLFNKNDAVKNMHTFKLLTRILDEQCEIVKDDNKDVVKLKAPKDIPSDSLQNPSDPDASYSGHKGQGYSAQIVETFQYDKNDATPNIITYAEVEPAHNSDANALPPAIEKVSKDGISPEEFQTDTSYGSDDNHQKASKKGIDLVAPVPAGNKKEDRFHLDDFELSDNGRIIACPEGQRPVSAKNNEKSRTIFFNSATCNKCKKNKMCPVKKGKKTHSANFTHKQIRLSMRRQYEQTAEFKNRYRMRAGIEATMSEYDRLTGVGRMRYRGLRTMQFGAVLKAAGVNILRAARAIAQQLRQKQDENQTKHPFLETFFIFKEQSEKFLGKIRKFLSQIFIPRQFVEFF